MVKALIIVESPAKIKTLQKFLGKDYIFASSIGHIRDLPQKGLGVDVDADFEPSYEVLAEKKDVVKKLKEAAKKVDVVYLSPDPDREGEAIAWHIAAILPPKTPIKRTAFNSITKDAVQEALAHPEEINQALVDAQQARRILDRLVGYKLSPLLGRKLGRRSGVSAGRVQSVALMLVVIREKEIEAFIPVEYWNVGAYLTLDQETKPFFASLYSVDGKKWQKEAKGKKNITLLSNKESADAVVSKLEKAQYTIVSVDKKEKKKNPSPPFITSTLQQEASRHFRFASARTMSTAQRLYEGVNGSEGLITYMRTDSVRIAPEALGQARGFIQKKYGEKYLPEKPRTFSKKKTAQDAHEAIRPTNLSNTPEKVRGLLTHDQYQLYTLIYKRFIASQMNPAIYDTISADIETDQNIVLRATGSTLKFDGFLALYQEREDDEETQDGENRLPPLEEGQKPKLDHISSEQAFTKPPPRFTEASLVKELEKSGIGRPSTYAPIMQKIQRREYTTKENGRLQPTELGRVITDFLQTNFEDVMDVRFTASLEDALELVAENKKEWKSVLKEFWTQFTPTYEKAEKEAFIPKLETDLECPKCGKPLLKIFAKSRYFYGCSAYPDCDYRASLEERTFNKEDFAENFNWDQLCPLCKEGMQVRFGRFGPFLGCSKYPDCKGIINIPKKGEEIINHTNLPDCPAIGCDGKIVARKSRFGKTFFSCSNYPDCDVIINEVDKLAAKYQDHPKTPYVKKAGGRKGRGGSLTPSKELAAVIGKEKVSRGQATKKIWEYIKKHDRQDPNDKRTILPDDLLAAVFGSKEPISMFKIAGFLAKNLK